MEYSCQVCKKTFPDDNKLSWHKFICNQPIRNIPISMTLEEFVGPVTLPCLKCNKKFYEKNKLIQHNKTCV